MSPMSRTQAHELRRDFDSAFAHTPREKDRRTVDLLTISLFGTEYALRLPSVAGLYANKKIARIPASRGGLLGIAGFRGTILPVYDLATLIGLPASVRPKWVAVAKSGDLAIAFDAFNGHLRVPEAAIAINEYTEGPRRFVSHLTQTDAGLLGIIDLNIALKGLA